MDIRKGIDNTTSENAFSRSEPDMKFKSKMQALEFDNIKTKSNFSLQVERNYHFTFKHLTIKRIFNASLCIFEMITKRSFLYSNPLFLRIEVCPYCNLRCPGCSLGNGDMQESNPNHRLEGAMKYKLFKESMQDFVPCLIKVWLYDEGEPLLNNEIYEMIKFLSNHNVGTCISSNFSLVFSDEKLEKIIDSGLEHLIIAVDGATKETYSQYRVGGDFDLVIDNIKRLQYLRSNKKGSPLKIEIQFLEFDHNKNEINKMYELAERLGVWRLTIMKGCHAGKELIRDITEEERRDKCCYEIWLGSTINSIGELGTCDYGEDHGIPNIGFAKHYMSKGLRNHMSLIHLRKSFRNDSVPLNEICKQCDRTIN